MINNRFRSCMSLRSHVAYRNGRKGCVTKAPYVAYRAKKGKKKNLRIRAHFEGPWMGGGGGGGGMLHVEFKKC